MIRRALLALALPLVAGAQAGRLPSVPPVVFLEKAYFSFLTPSGKGLLFEGQPSVHYFFLNTLDNPNWQRGDAHLAWTAGVSELFVVRMTRDSTRLQSGEFASSEPVLTPSYHIGFRQQLFWLWRPDNSLHYILAGLTANELHHSNGQHGCTYLGSSRDKISGKCKVDDVALASQRIANTIDGDFSTTHFGLAGNVRWAQLAGIDKPMLWQLTGGLEWRRDPLDFSAGGTSFEQATQYGQHEWIVRSEGEHWNPKTWPGFVRLAYERRMRGGQINNPSLTAQTFELSYVFDRLSHVGVFARYHTGFDYYNIHFQETAPFFSIGAMWDIGRLDRLNPKFSQ